MRFCSVVGHVGPCPCAHNAPARSFHRRKASAAVAPQTPGDSQQSLSRSHRTSRLRGPPPCHGWMVASPPQNGHVLARGSRRGSSASPIWASLRPVSRAFKACAYLRVCVKVYRPAPVHPCGCARLGPEECHPEGPYFWPQDRRGPSHGRVRLRIFARKYLARSLEGSPGVVSIPWRRHRARTLAKATRTLRVDR